MIDEKVSNIIQFLRYPLAVLVVALHILPAQILPWKEVIGNGEKIYLNLFHTPIIIIASLAVPIFFVISGYLLFVKIDKISVSWYKRKVKDKIRTLLLPYMFWNLVGCMYLYLTQNIELKSLYWMFISGPANFPLWFVRNLFVMMLISPIFYFMVKHTNILGLMTMSVLFIVCNGYLLVSWYVPISIYFFYFGCYCGVNKYDMTSDILSGCKIKKVMISLCLVLLAVKTIVFGNANNIVTNIYLLMGVFAVIFISDTLVNKKGLYFPLILSQASFFIYLTHKLGPTFLSKLPFDFITNDEMRDIAILLISPIIASLICVFFYRIMKAYVPFLLFFRR